MVLLLVTPNSADDGNQVHLPAATKSQKIVIITPSHGEFLALR